MVPDFATEPVENPPAETPPVETPPEPPAPASPPAPSEPPRSDDDRIGALETMMENIMEVVTGVLAKEKETEAQPQKLPWTHRGGRKS